MFDFATNVEFLRSELLDEIKLFFPFGSAPAVRHNASVENDVIFNEVELDGKLFARKEIMPQKADLLLEKRIFKHACKKAIYLAFSEFTGKAFPWGSLTGIRPSKLIYDMFDEGLSIDECGFTLQNRYFVSEEKSKLICDIVKNQASYVNCDDKLFNLYVHIPFCTSKCSYCSFTTQLLDKSLNVIDDYLSTLKREIVRSIEFINANGKLLSVYVGGGTPTAISAEQIFLLFDGVNFSNVEFTIEAGRPDTITKEKLDAIKNVGATRICVNPQSLNDNTLKAIGRSHTAQDFYEKYELASIYGFDVNVDLIAGLANESLDDFIYTLNKTIELSPDNVTVHTLSRKNGSNLKLTGVSYTNDEIEAMTSFARRELGKSGYIPYYLYRQKQMLGNLENVGYCKSGKQCVNNISTMEEFNSVIACGAGAISKIVQGRPSKIERFANMRDVKLYLDRFDERLEAKEKFLLENIKNN